jgi:hypothetical protein
VALQVNINILHCPMIPSILIFGCIIRKQGQAVKQLVQALRYQTEGRGFDSRNAIGIFHWHNPTGPSLALGPTQPLADMSTKNISWEVKEAGA